MLQDVVSRPFAGDHSVLQSIGLGEISVEPLAQFLMRHRPRSVNHVRVIVACFSGEGLWMESLGRGWMTIVVHADSDDPSHDAIAFGLRCLVWRPPPPPHGYTTQMPTTHPDGADSRR